MADERWRNAEIADPLYFGDAQTDNAGALELIELGNPRAKKMITNARRAQLGQIPNVFGYFFGVVGEGVSKLADILSTVLKIPVDLISKGVGEVLGGFASIVGEIPVIGEIAAAVLLAANSIIQMALSLPGEILKVVKNLGEAFKTLKPEEQKSLTQSAIGLLVKAAPPEHKVAVEQKLQQAPPPGEVEIPGEDVPVGEILAVAANAAAIGAFFIV